MKLDIPLQLKYGGIALICMGSLSVLAGGIMLIKTREAQSWPTVEARVIRSEVEVTKKAIGIRRGTAGFSDYYGAAIRYEYVVNGETHTGKRICMDEGTTGGFDRHDAEEWVRKNPVGTTIRVHHSPSQPQRSVIDPNAGGLTPVFVKIGGILAIIGGILARRYAKQMQPEEEKRIELREQESFPIAPVEASSPNTAVPPRPLHWLIATPSVVTGLLLFALGGLCLPYSVKRYVFAVNATDGGNPAASFFAIAIFAGMLLFGAFLIWYPLKRRSSAGVDASELSR